MEISVGYAAIIHLKKYTAIITMAVMI